MAWQSVGFNTWQQGRFRLYRSTMPADVYWLSIDGQPPIRCETKEEVRGLIKQTNGKNK